MRIVIYGLTITRRGGNGHATTYRSLTKALKQRGHTVQFVEKDVEWYRSNRDLPEPEFCTVQTVQRLEHGREGSGAGKRWGRCDRGGSYFPDAVALTRELLIAGRGRYCSTTSTRQLRCRGCRKKGAPNISMQELIPHYAAYLSFTEVRR